jgi:hypothetical protein
MKFRIPTLNTAVLAAIVVAGIFVVVFVYWIFRGTSITVINGPQNEHAELIGPLTGNPCANAKRRPIAVMLASDPEARPLAGIGQADMVFEMPVTPNGITRMMAVFQCRTPKEIGSVRSARQDFIPLAQGIDAILAHWGGEHDALAQLNNHIIDNVDALLYEGTTFYRKPKIPRPHNGFTTVPLIWERADQLSYRASTSMSGYQHLSEPVKRDVAITADTISISWPQGMDVRFSYDEATRTYLRWRGGTPELDATTGEQARASVVITMTTTATFLRDQYISVKTVGSGVARIAQGGVTISALWNKRNATDMLTFTDSKGAPIPLEPGTIWVLINAPLPAVTQ